MWLRILTLVFAFIGFAGAGHAQSEKTTLITLKDGKPVAALAKSWKKLGQGKYEFQLDTTATIGKKKPLTTDAVKSSLEGKLGSTLGVKVAAKGKTAVEVTYAGEEAAFLAGVAGAKIRATKGVELALDSSTTQGGIRARAADRKPMDDEVKATVVTNSQGILTVRVLESGLAGEAAKFKAGEKAQVEVAADAKPNDVVYFVPEAVAEGKWKAKSLNK